jgi:hypothetical protein
VEPVVEVIIRSVVWKDRPSEPVLFAQTQQNGWTITSMGNLEKGKARAGMDLKGVTNANTITIQLRNLHQ